MMEKLLICTDLDRTLIPNGPAPESPQAEALFASFAHQPTITLVYVSGRDRKLVEAAIAEYNLPAPDYVIGDVGTTIYSLDSDQDWQRNEYWENGISRDWKGLGHADLVNILSDLPGLRLQEPSKQNRFKLSFYVDASGNGEELHNAVSGRLQQEGVRARLVTSIDDITGQGLLDVLPSSASKRHAIEALVATREFELDRTVFCGDSGNDLEVLASPIPAVLVANARPEVKQQAARLARQSGYTEKLYIAQGGFLGLNGNYRGGMLEGIAHYHPSVGEQISNLVNESPRAAN